MAANPTRDEIVETACRVLVNNDEGGFFGAAWPETPEDDGHRGGSAYVRLMSKNDQAALRAAMGFVVDGVLKGIAQAVPALLVDATRYRWLRIDPVWPEGQGLFDPEDLDEAIDRALKNGASRPSEA